MFDICLFNFDYSQDSGGGREGADVCLTLPPASAREESNHVPGGERICSNLQYPLSYTPTATDW
jgi:hypothetical protein